MDRMSRNRIYVGNLPYDVRKDELERMFDRFGEEREAVGQSTPPIAPPSLSSLWTAHCS